MCLLTGVEFSEYCYSTLIPYLYGTVRILTTQWRRVLLSIAVKKSMTYSFRACFFSYRLCILNGNFGIRIDDDMQM